MAEKIEKDHKNLLRDINKYVTVLDSLNLSSHNFFYKKCLCRFKVNPSKGFTFRVWIYKTASSEFLNRC